MVWPQLRHPLGTGRLAWRGESTCSLIIGSPRSKTHQAFLNPGLKLREREPLSLLLKFSFVGLQGDVYLEQPLRSRPEPIFQLLTALRTDAS
jgi:hypothetical protein